MNKFGTMYPYVFRFNEWRKYLRYHQANFGKIDFEKKKVILFYFDPYNDIKSGGILSILFLMECTHKLYPDAIVLPVTVAQLPSYCSVSWVENKYLIANLKKLKNKLNVAADILIHVPETLFQSFCKACVKHRIEVNNIVVNILNQNQEQMPDDRQVLHFKHLFKKVSVTLAFEVNFDEKFSFSDFPPKLITSWFLNHKVEDVPFSEKEDLAIISPDPHPFKDEVIKILTDLKIRSIEIRNMPFGEFMKLQRAAKWSFSFGEGYDGYSIGAFFKSGIGFGVFNAKFFPPNFLANPTENFYKSYEALTTHIKNDIQKLNNQKAYEELVSKVKPMVLHNNSPQKVINNLREYYTMIYGAD